MAPFNCDKRMMFGSPVYTVNNNMFAGAHQSSLFVRLSEHDRQDLRARHPDARPFEPMEGRVMKEYMLLPMDVYHNAETVARMAEPRPRVRAVTAPQAAQAPWGPTEEYLMQKEET